MTASTASVADGQWTTMYGTTLKVLVKSSDMNERAKSETFRLADRLVGKVLKEAVSVSSSGSLRDAYELTAHQLRDGMAEKIEADDDKGHWQCVIGTRFAVKLEHQQGKFCHFRIGEGLLPVDVLVYKAKNKW